LQESDSRYTDVAASDMDVRMRRQAGLRSCDSMTLANFKSYEWTLGL
jgi:hypothetical protein